LLLQAEIYGVRVQAKSRIQLSRAFRAMTRRSWATAVVREARPAPLPDTVNAHSPSLRQHGECAFTVVREEVECAFTYALVTRMRIPPRSPAQRMRIHRRYPEGFRMGGVFMPYPLESPQTEDWGCRQAAAEGLPALAAMLRGARVTPSAPAA
jgi:hypothetical protein